MFEHSGVLVAFRIMELPPTVSNRKDQCRVQMERLADHRLVYLSYEGAISDNRGCVTRIADGCFQATHIDNSATVLYQLQGDRLQAMLEIPFCDPHQTIAAVVLQWQLDRDAAIQKHV